MDLPQLAGPAALVLVALVGAWQAIRVTMKKLRGEQQLPPAATYESMMADMAALRQEIKQVRQDNQREIDSVRREARTLGDGFDALYTAVDRNGFEVTYTPHEREAIDAARKLRTEA